MGRWFQHGTIATACGLAVYQASSLYRHRTSEAQSLHRDVARAISSDLSAGREMPLGEDLMRSSAGGGSDGTVVVARLPCRSPGLAGYADVVVRHHKTTPDEVADRMAMRREREAAMRTAKAASDAIAAAEPVVLPTPPAANTHAPTIAPATWAWSKVGTTPPTSPAATSQATATATPSVARPVTTVAATEHHHQLHIVESSMPPILVRHELNTWSAWWEQMRFYATAIVYGGGTASGKSAAMASPNASWLFINTAADKDRERQFLRESLAMSNNGRTQRNLLQPADVAGSTEGVDGKPKMAAVIEPVATSALKFASVRIEPKESPDAADDDAARSERAQVFSSNAQLALTKCVATPTASLSLRDISSSCVPDPKALPDVAGRLMAGAFAMLPFPLPTNSHVAVLGLGTGALPQFIQQNMYQLVDRLSVVDAEPAVLEAAVAHTGMHAVSLLNSRRMELHAIPAEEFLIRQAEKVDVLLVDFTNGGEAAEHKLRALQSGNRWASDSRYSVSFAKLCKLSLTGTGVAAFAVDDSNPADKRHFIDACRSVFGQANVFELPVGRDENAMAAWIAGIPRKSIVLAARTLPTNGLSPRHVAARYEQLGKDMKWPFDPSVHLPASFLLW